MIGFVVETMAPLLASKESGERFPFARSPAFSISYVYTVLPSKFKISYFWISHNGTFETINGPKLNPVDVDPKSAY